MHIRIAEKQCARLYFLSYYYYIIAFSRSKYLLTKIFLYCIMYGINFAVVAQLVEQLIRNQQAVGSSPTSSTMKKVTFVYRQR